MYTLCNAVITIHVELEGVGVVLHGSLSSHVLTTMGAEDIAPPFDVPPQPAPTPKHVPVPSSLLTNWFRSAQAVAPSSSTRSDFPPPPQPARFINTTRSPRCHSRIPESSKPSIRIEANDAPRDISTPGAPSCTTHPKKLSESILLGRKSQSDEDDSEYQGLLVEQGRGYPLRKLKPISSTSHHPSVSSPFPVVQRRHFAPHSPVPATTIFSRNAAPLDLPKLDKYVASLSPPSFSSPLDKGKDRGPVMFPPMDRLSASNRTLDDLERNSEIVPAWRSRQLILGSFVSIVLGVTVCYLSRPWRRILFASSGI
jgi:hypothetical protein